MRENSKYSNNPSRAIITRAIICFIS